MIEDMGTTELLAAWRDAVRAADLAARLAEQATEAALEADLRAEDAEEVARLAEGAAEAAMRTADRARGAARAAAEVARGHRERDVPDSEQAADIARREEKLAGGAYHAAEYEVRQPKRD
jgi:hypothetical protein